MPEETSVAVADTPETEAADTPPATPRLDQSVHLADVGPCRKHVRVIVSRADIDAKLKEKFNEMMPEAQVPGYRPGKAPRKLIEKKFFKEVADQIKSELLLQSLEQLAEDHQLNPISQPNIDPFKIELPEQGPLTYEFEIEVAPEFDLPEYKGLKLKRPVKTISAEEVAAARKKFLSRFGELEAKEGSAALEDLLVADVTIELEGKQLSEFKDLEIRVDPQLAFKDGLAADFGSKMQGAKVGETRTVDIRLSPALVDETLRGKVATGHFTVKRIQRLKLPELTPAFFEMLGMEGEDALNARLREALESKFEYEQRQAARSQVLEHIAAAANWDLPSDLLHRQARRNLSRRVLEMRNAGFSEDEIRARANLLQQDSLASTARGLKEHFVLQKIAEVEKLDVSQEDIEGEIEAIAEQTDESPRKVRARLEREDMMETLVSEILERKALDLVLEHADYTDVPYQAQDEAAVAGVEATATGVDDLARPVDKVTPEDLVPEKK